MNIDSASNQRRLFFPTALANDDWQTDVLLTVSADGWITEIRTGANSADADQIHDAVALPGMTNVHSHAFQRAMAGLSEYRTSEQDNFWTWRRLMYDFLGRLHPEDLYIVARQLYIEMLLAGYTWVGEFHYLHHDIGGQRYENLAEMSDTVRRAAADVGIGICLIPVLYQRGGFDNAPLSGGQLRFEMKTDEYLALFEQLKRATHHEFAVGAALHSLRAVSIDVARHMVDAVRQIKSACPIHIHVAEQMGEVSACQQHHGRRSVEFLYDSVAIDEHWCLIHATHISDEEISRIAASGATVCLCPTTEANLGDGIFPAPSFVTAGGRFAIGGDSHCSIDFRDELRTLEYGQRLKLQQRAILTDEKYSVGRFLYQHAAEQGGRAIGVKTGRIEVGYRADLTLVDPSHPAIVGATKDALLDRLIFCHADDPVIGAMVSGREHSMTTPEFLDLVFTAQQDFSRLMHRL